jgi:hypothetical protein
MGKFVLRSDPMEGKTSNEFPRSDNVVFCQ